MKQLAIVSAAAVAFALATSPAQAQFVATIFISPCQAEIPVFTTATMRVWVCMEGPIAEGLMWAEFRVNGVPSNWITAVHPNPAAVTFDGDVLGDGVRVAFPACQPGVGQYLELCAIDITPTDVKEDVLLAVAATIPPSDPSFQCPFVTQCDQTSTKICVGGYGAWVNPRSFGCPLAAASLTWGRVKSLYQ